MAEFPLIRKHTPRAQLLKRFNSAASFKGRRYKDRGRNEKLTSWWLVNRRGANTPNSEMPDRGNNFQMGVTK
jgi:hypothetical protein